MLATPSAWAECGSTVSAPAPQVTRWMIAEAISMADSQGKSGRKGARCCNREAAMLDAALSR